MRALQIGDSISELKVKHGQLIAHNRSSEIENKQAPLEDLGIVVIESLNGLNLNLHVLQGFLESNTALVVCDRRHLPAGVLLPLFGTLDHGAVLAAQFALSRPQSKRIWKRLIAAKLRHQAKNLPLSSRKRKRIQSLAAGVKSGDPDNYEAQGARIYWKALFGDQFRREPRAGEGINAALDYGYAVVRATLARAIVGSGLHPSVGVFHSPRANPMCLVDDLIEPLRPLVDRHIANLETEIIGKLNPENKREIVGVLTESFMTKDKSGLLGEVCERYADSYKRFITSGSEKIDIPTWRHDG